MNLDAHTDALTAKIRDLERRCAILQETVRTQGRFADIAGILSTVVDLPKLASSLLNGVFSATQLKAGMFLLPDASESIRVIDSLGMDLGAGGFGLLRSLSSRASQSLDIITQECASGDGVALHDELPAGGPESLMLAAVSCRYEGAVNSILVFASRGPISFDALSFINALSKNVGLSVNNALSYETIKRTTEELNSERNKLNAVMYNIADGLLVTDTEGVIVRVNRACLELFGYGKEDMAGKRADEVFVPALRELVENGTRTGKRNAISLEIDIPGNKIAKAMATPLVQESGSTCIGVVILIRDITREKEVDRMKTHFLTTVSHELRTPLTSILGFARIIRKKMRDTVSPRIATKDGTVLRAIQQVSHNIEIIESEGERLTALINDVLDLAKMEAGKVQWKYQRIQLGEIIDTAVSVTSALYQQKGLVLVREVQEGLPDIIGDRDRLVQVVINLLSNAIKFTDQGQVIVTAVATQDPAILPGSGAPSVTITVKDSGIGIAVDEFLVIFEKFRQVGNTLTDKPKGTGLGLPICKEIVEHHGGRIWVDSTLGEGSAFSFTIPAAGHERSADGRDGLLLSNLREHVLTGARSILDSVYASVERIHLDIESEKRSILAGRKRELKNLVLLTESHIRNVRSLVERNEVGEEEAKQGILEELRSFKYGNNDYLYVSDLNSVLLSHPDPASHHADYSRVVDIHGTLVVPPLVDIVKRAGEGYHSYYWRRLEAEEPLEKLVYGKYIPEWNWVVATGVYISDIEQEAMRRKKHEIEQLRRMLRKLRIAKTGYIYIFDSRGSMIIHPNPDREGTGFGQMINPETGELLFRELIKASRMSDHRHTYKWDKPEDPGNYHYDKMAWVRYFKGFDWYIGSSVYVEELYEASQDLARTSDSGRRVS